MNPNVFRKGDAASCLVVSKTWDDVLNTPGFFKELAERLIEMMENAEDIGRITKATTFGQFKKAINEILLDPLRHDPSSPDSGKDTPEPGTILVDAFWDEIISPNKDWERLQEAIEKAAEVKKRIEEHVPLTSSDTLQNTKDNFNQTIVEPLNGINLDE